MEDYEKRLQDILGADMDLSGQSAERYRLYLLSRLSLPVLVTGTEDFPWEEPYVLGVWDRKEYEVLKKTNPSFTDTFELNELSPPLEDHDIVAHVRRVSDGKFFEMGLSWLSAAEEQSETGQLLNDYGIWHTNY